MRSDRRAYSQQEVEEAVAEERQRCANAARRIADNRDESVLAHAVALKILSEIERG